MTAIMLNDNEKSIQEILKSEAKHPIDTCLDLYKIISASQCPEKLLQTVLEHPSPIGKKDDEVPVAVTEDKFEVFARQNFNYIIQYTRLLARKNLPQDEFYKSLYEDLFNPGNDMLPSSEDPTLNDIFKAFILVLLANHVRCVPYYQLTEEQDLTDEIFKDSVSRLETKLKNARHILQRDFVTKTAEGVQLYRVMESINNETDKVVFLALMLSMVREEAQRNNR